MNDTEREQVRRLEVLRTYKAAAESGHEQTKEVLRAEMPELRSKFDEIDRKARHNRGGVRLEKRDFQEASEA